MAIYDPTMSGLVAVLVSVQPSDGIAGMAALDATAWLTIASAWRSEGFDLLSLRRATAEDLEVSWSSWARRLGSRPAWRLELRRRE